MGRLRNHTSCHCRKVECKQLVVRYKECTNCLHFESTRTSFEPKKMQENANISQESSSIRKR